MDVRSPAADGEALVREVIPLERGVEGMRQAAAPGVLKILLAT